MVAWLPFNSAASSWGQTLNPKPTCPNYFMAVFHGLGIQTPGRKSSKYKGKLRLGAFKGLGFRGVGFKLEGSGCRFPGERI